MAENTGGYSGLSEKEKEKLGQLNIANATTRHIQSRLWGGREDISNLLQIGSRVREGIFNGLTRDHAAYNSLAFAVRDLVHSPQSWEVAKSVDNLYDHRTIRSSHLSSGSFLQYDQFRNPLDNSEISRFQTEAGEILFRIENQQVQTISTIPSEVQKSVAAISRRIDGVSVR